MSASRYDTPPRTLTSLDQRLRNLRTEEQLRLRVRRQIAHLAVVSALRQHATDKQGAPLFLIKGGTAIELLMGLKARATKDLDSSVRAAGEEIEPTLRNALASGWDGFTFRLESWRQIGTTHANRGEIKVQYNGRSFSTVRFEAAPAEGESGQELAFADNTLIDPADLGLSEVADVPIVPLSYLIAQKLHACTDHDFDDFENDRARDLVDILLLHPLIGNDELPNVKRVCEEIFELRDRHAWPPNVTVPDQWVEIFKVELEKVPGFEPADVYEAASQVTAFIREIDAAH